MNKKNTLAEFALLPADEGTGNCDRLACQACGLYKCAGGQQNLPVFQKSHVPLNWSKKLLIIEEHPTNNKVRPMFYRLAKKAGLNRDDIAFTFALRCAPKNEAKPTINQIRLCRGFLVRLLSKLNPQRVLVAGATALRSVTNGESQSISDRRGRPVPIAGFKKVCYVTYHPESVLKGATHFENEILEDLQRDTLPKLIYPENICPKLYP